MQGSKKQGQWSQCLRKERDIWFPRVSISEGHDYVDFYRALLERNPDNNNGFGATLCITLGDIVTVARRKESYLVTLIWSWKMDSEFVFS